MVCPAVVSSPDNSGITNHVELKISQNQIDVHATDAGVAPSPATLAVINNANLSFTRGLIWLEDVHYNADKAESGPNVPSQKQHTFVWDNVAFDGPFTYRDFSYDAQAFCHNQGQLSEVGEGRSTEYHRRREYCRSTLMLLPACRDERAHGASRHACERSGTRKAVNQRLHPSSIAHSLIFLLQPLLFAATRTTLLTKQGRRRRRTSASACCCEYLLARFLFTSRYVITTALRSRCSHSPESALLP